MYGSYDITFPSFGLTVKAGRVAFVLFGKPIYWYGIIIALGFGLAIWYAVKNCKRFGVDPDDLINCILIGTPSAVICARIYYILGNPEPYRGDFWSLFKIWEGGLGMYGVIIGAVVSVFIYSRVKKMKLLPFLDMLVVGFILAQAIGRWGNFMNREAFGLIPAGTTGFLRKVMEFFTMNFVKGTETVSVQPTFLYESVWNLIVFIILLAAVPKRKFDGQIALMYFALYGFGRFFIEGLRTDSLYIGSTGIRTSQLVAAVTCILSVILLLIIFIKKKPDGSKLEGVRLAAIEEEKARLAQEELARKEEEAKKALEEKFALSEERKELYARQAEQMKSEAATQAQSAIGRAYTAPKEENVSEEKLRQRREAKVKMIAEAKALGLILDEDGNFIEQIEPGDGKDA